MTSLLQVFYWGTAAGFSGGRQYYDSFSLNGCDYQVGDAVSLFPEDDAQPHFLARLESAYIDSTASDPHVITVSWYERRDNQEVVELGETDVNPIGCISGKVQVFHCNSSVEAQKLARCVDQEWFFCRSQGAEMVSGTCGWNTDVLRGKDLSKGMDRQPTHQMDDADYSEDEVVGHSRHVKQEAGPKRQRHSSGGAGMVMLDSLQREELEAFHRGRNPPSYRPAPAKAAPGVLLGGRTCVQCNATQTPQWREGPAGPKTLCNACGVRYCRLQQRDNKKPHGSGAARRGGTLATTASKPARTGKGRKDSWKGGARDPMEYAVDPYAVDMPTTRPVRQAALLSATRTAEYARTGIFPSSSSMQEQDNNSYHNEGRFNAEAQGGEGAADWGEQEEGVDMQDDPEGDEELEDQGTGDSCAATAAGVRISSGSEPTSPNGSSLHTHGAELGSIALNAMQQRALATNGSGLALTGRGSVPTASTSRLQVQQHATDSHTHPKQTGLPSSTRGSGSGDSPDSAFDSIDAMLLLAAGGRNAAADAALLESGTGSPLTACELQELMLLAALGGPLGDVSCAPSPMSACTGGLGSRTGQSGFESNESSQQLLGFLTLSTRASEELLAGAAAPGGHVTEEDVRFSLSIRAEHFCPEFDVETYQSAFAPYDNLKESLQEDVLEKLHTSGESSQKQINHLSGLPQTILAAPLGDINSTTNSLAALASQATQATAVLLAPTPTSLNTPCPLTATDGCSAADDADDCRGLSALLAAATEASDAKVLEEQVPQATAEVAGPHTAQAHDVCPPEGPSESLGAGGQAADMDCAMNISIP